MFFIDQEEKLGQSLQSLHPQTDVLKRFGKLTCRCGSLSPLTTEGVSGDWHRWALNQRSLHLFQTQISWWEGLEGFALSRLPSMFLSTTSMQTARMLLLWALVPWFLHHFLWKGWPLPRVFGNGEGRTVSQLYTANQDHAWDMLFFSEWEHSPTRGWWQSLGLPLDEWAVFLSWLHSQKYLCHHKHLTWPFPPKSSLSASS